MAIIPAAEKVFMVSNSTNTTYSGSAALKAMQQWYTMQDVIDTVGGGGAPYKVFTALLTQSGASNPDAINNDSLVIGTTYEILSTDGDTADFTNVGAPNNLVGTSFIATGTTPTSWGQTNDGLLGFNSGTPIAIILENTIGNMYFSYDGVGYYGINSGGLFTTNKTTFSINLMGDDISQESICLGYIFNNNTLGITTGNPAGQSDGILYWSTPIEIRVYN